MPTSNREVCDTCGKRRKVRFGNLTRAFCSAECANEYLESEGFCHRVIDQEKTRKKPGKADANVA